MSDGRQQDGDMPLALQRQDGGGQRDPLPGTEAARGNVEPEVQGAVPERTVGGEDGFSVIEMLGVAESETRMAEEREP